MHMSAHRLEPDTVLLAYTQGAFPMTDRDGVTRWYTADPRGVIPLSGFHIPRTLRQIVRQKLFDVRINHGFSKTMRACMTGHPGGSWISEDLIRVYSELHNRGFAHSVEAWKDGELVGGLYGVTIGGAFFGESMFHSQRDASKVALVHLVERLGERKFTLLDTQASTSHLERFGCIELPADEYMSRLRKALNLQRKFD
jgi:leucyl/phenylalanyl-tRNA--protein transferase